MSHSSYLIGVDTGGTYTDCAIIEARGHKVVARAKAITTKGDLAIGVSEAINQAVAQLPAGLAPQDIGLVSVSTTLATNAVVEGHGSPVAVVLVGFDDRMAERTGIASAFPDCRSSGSPAGMTTTARRRSRSTCRRCSRRWTPSRRRWTRLRSHRRSRCAMRRMSRPCATTSWPPPASR